MQDFNVYQSELIEAIEHFFHSSKVLDSNFINWKNSQELYPLNWIKFFCVQMRRMGLEEREWGGNKEGTRNPTDKIDLTISRLHGDGGTDCTKPPLTCECEFRLE